MKKSNYSHNPEFRSSRDSLFRHNGAYFTLSMVGIVFKVLSVLGFSRFIQKILDTISGDQVSGVLYLAIYGGICIGLLLVGAIFEHAFWTAFRSKALTQYRQFTCNKILRKGIAAWSHENTAPYISALSGCRKAPFFDRILPRGRILPDTASHSPSAAGGNLPFVSYKVFFVTYTPAAVGVHSATAHQVGS